MNYLDFPSLTENSGVYCAALLSVHNFPFLRGKIVIANTGSDHLENQFGFDFNGYTNVFAHCNLIAVVTFLVGITD